MTHRTAAAVATLFAVATIIPRGLCGQANARQSRPVVAVVVNQLGSPEVLALVEYHAHRGSVRITFRREKLSRELVATALRYAERVQQRRGVDRVSVAIPSDMRLLPVRQDEWSTTQRAYGVLMDARDDETVVLLRPRGH
jgi:hypothetical protein